MYIVSFCAMNSRIHLMIVTTLSMIMTFILYSILQDTRAAGFVYQTMLVDITRDVILSIRCFSSTKQSKFTMKDRRLFLLDFLLVDKESCKYILDDNENHLKHSLILINILFVVLLILFGYDKIMFYTSPSIYTITGIWLLGRFFDKIHLEYQVDIFTMYLLVWQLMFIAVKWEFEQYAIFSLTFYRGWLCFLMACNAFIFHDTACRYLPAPIIWMWFWLFSIKDM